MKASSPWLYLLHCRLLINISEVSTVLWSSVALDYGITKYGNLTGLHDCETWPLLTLSAGLLTAAGRSHPYFPHQDCQDVSMLVPLSGMIIPPLSALKMPYYLLNYRLNFTSSETLPWTLRHGYSILLLVLITPWISPLHFLYL